MNTITSTPQGFSHKKEMHKLHHAFTVASGQTVHKGELVKLTTTGDITPATSGEVNINIIGFCVQNGEAGEVVTVQMRANAINVMSADGATNAGPVKTTGFNTTTGRAKASDATVDATNVIGWAVEAAADAGDILVAMI